MKELMKKRLNQKGLTLIELLAVIVILAIIAAIAIPAIASIIQKQEEKSVLADAQQVISSAKLAYSDGACTEDPSNKKITCTGAQLKDYLDDVDFDDADNVTKESSGEWTINWTSKKDYKFEKISGASVVGATESKINGWLK